MSFNDIGSCCLFIVYLTSSKPLHFQAEVHVRIQGSWCNYSKSDENSRHVWLRNMTNDDENFRHVWLRNMTNQWRIQQMPDGGGRL